MDISKGVLFFHFFVFFFLLVGDYHLATKFVTASTATRERVDVCRDILKTKWKNDYKNTEKQCGTLTVWVPKNTAFTNFVKFNEDGELIGGFSIAIFCLVLQELPFKMQLEFVPFDVAEGSYDELVQKIENKTCAAVVGDITITKNRTKYADFTIPYMSSEIYMLVPARQKLNQTLLTLIKPFTIRLWLTIICACIFIGVAIGILEYRVGNPEFNVPFYQNLIMIVWFPVSTFFFHEGRILNRCSKIVLVIWLMTIFIVIQIFTACLSSWLTVNQLHFIMPKLPKSIGYQTGSCVGDFANTYKNSSLHKLSNMEDFKNALDMGTVDAIFEELPHIDIFIANYGDTYKKLGPMADEPGFGFAFVRGSTLQQKFSRALVNVIGSPAMSKMKERYLGVKTGLQMQPEDSLLHSLDVNSFFLLFMFMGVATIIAIIFSEITLMRTPTRISPEMLEM